MSPAKFKGLVDEFRLYKQPLSDDSIHGLVWFLNGANNLVIPRGIFYDSKLYAGLNGTFDGNSPFAGATAYGNSNTLSSNLNSRVIQMVIAKNLTLAQAWGILDLARTNKTNSVTAFPYFATAEFYTLGLSWEVSKLTANTSVVNGGNYSYPPPPSNLWALFWNTIAGWAERAWNAVLAVGAFFANVGKWLVQALMSVVKGLTSGNWTDFKRIVLGPILDALSALMAFLKNVIVLALKPLITPAIDGLRQWQRKIFFGAGPLLHSSWLKYQSVQGSGKTEAIAAGSIVFGTEFQATIVLMTVIAAIIAALRFIMPLVSLIVVAAFAVVLLVVADQFTGGSFWKPTSDVPPKNLPQGLRPQFGDQYPDIVPGIDVGKFLDWFFFVGGIALDLIIAGVAIWQVLVAQNPASEPPAIALAFTLWTLGVLLIGVDYLSIPNIEVRLWAYVFSAGLASLSMILSVAEVFFGKIDVLRALAVYSFLLSFGAFGKAVNDYCFLIGRR